VGFEPTTAFHGIVVSKRLGHSTINITLDTYSHVLPGLRENGAQKVADAIFGT
jgi:integrase